MHMRSLSLGPRLAVAAYMRFTAFGTRKRRKYRYWRKKRVAGRDGYNCFDWRFDGIRATRKKRYEGRHRCDGTDTVRDSLWQGLCYSQKVQGSQAARRML